MTRPACSAWLATALLVAACSDAQDAPTEMSESAGSGTGAAGSQTAGSGTGAAGSGTAGETSEASGGAGGAAPGASCELAADMGSAECDECMVQSCCGPMDACVADGECISALQCADTCALESEDDTEFGECLDACFGGPEPPQLLDEMFLCQEELCVDACFSGG